jgi:hypothetical protein
MRWNKSSLIVITVCLVGFSTVILFLVSRDRPSKDQETYFYPLSELVFGFYTYESEPLHDLLLYAGSDRNDTIKLRQLSSGGVLVLRFSGETCSTCIDFALERLRKTFPDFAHNDRIILLSSQVATRLKKSYYGKSVYSFFDEGQELPFDQYRTPYFFYLDDRLEYKLFFIPDQNQTKVTDFYLNTFKRRFGF